MCLFGCLHMSAYVKVYTTYQVFINHLIKKLHYMYSERISLFDISIENQTDQYNKGFRFLHCVVVRRVQFDLCDIFRGITELAITRSLYFVVLEYHYTI